jgi:prepilin-type processing-associated H-X9-DG protein
MTCYLGMTGRNWLDFQTGDTGVLGLYPSRLGVKITEITDGASGTLLIGERPPQRDLYWGWWRGVDYDSLMWAINPKAGAANWFNQDGTPCNFPAIFSPGNINNDCDVNHYWSQHIGGSNFAFCDGAVRFLAYTAGPIIVPQLATRAGGEVVSGEF